MLFTLHVRPPPMSRPLRRLQSSPPSNPEGLLPTSLRIQAHFLKYLYVHSFQNQTQKTICHSCLSPAMFSYCHVCLFPAKQYAFSQSHRQDQPPTAPAEFREQPLSAANQATRIYVPTVQNREFCKSSLSHTIPLSEVLCNIKNV